MTDLEKLERVVALCKGEVTLTANGHRTYYETVRARVTYTLRGWFADKEAYRPEDGPSEEALAEIEAGGTLWTLQFFPETPNGSHTLHDSRLGRLLDRALAVLGEG